MTGNVTPLRPGLALKSERSLQLLEFVAQSLLNFERDGENIEGLAIVMLGDDGGATAAVDSGDVMKAWHAYSIASTVLVDASLSLARGQ